MKLAPNAVSISHMLARQIVEIGDTVVDATAGNGHDTVYLAQLVGPSGQIYAFDIQEEAILSTHQRVVLANLESRVNIIHDGHQNIDKYVNQPIKLVMFNLGYLHGGDKKIITKPTTTLEAIKKSLKLLESDGVVLLTVYTGHPGGQEEWEKIQPYLTELPKEQYDVVMYKHLNRSLSHPFTIMVQYIGNS